MDVPACGDGCCHEERLSIDIDDHEIFDEKVEYSDKTKANQIAHAIKSVLSHLKIEAEIEVL